MSMTSTKQPPAMKIDLLIQKLERGENIGTHNWDGDHAKYIIQRLEARGWEHYIPFSEFDPNKAFAQAYMKKRVKNPEMGGYQHYESKSMQVHLSLIHI